jgi:hypothetical protein
MFVAVETPNLTHILMFCIIINLRGQQCSKLKGTGVLLEKLVVTQVVKKFAAFYAIWRRWPPDL